MSDLATTKAFLVELGRDRIPTRFDESVSDRPTKIKNLLAFILFEPPVGRATCLRRANKLLVLLNKLKIESRNSPAIAIANASNELEHFSCLLSSKEPAHCPSREVRASTLSKCLFSISYSRRTKTMLPPPVGAQGEEHKSTQGRQARCVGIAPICLVNESSPRLLGGGEVLIK